MSDNPLGNKERYSTEQAYSPGLLFSIPRLENRCKLNITKDLPFNGWDRWNAYEFSYLDNTGKPVSAFLQFDVPCDSSYIVESKSLKLYLNSLSFKSFENVESVESLLKQDLEKLVESPVYVKLFTLDHLSQQSLTSFKSLGLCIDHYELSGQINFDQVAPQVLLLEKDTVSSSALSITIQETLSSHLFRSHCPVTNQPDWASIVVTYHGEAINHASLLRYILSFRKHQGFHEDCVERIFTDIQRVCKPEKLSVYAAFTRRGGIDINPFRSNFESKIPFGRFVRQ